MRSSSVAPFGVATAPSHAIVPVCASIASSRPPAVPVSRPPRLTVPPAALRIVSGGFVRASTHSVLPSAAASP